MSSRAARTALALFLLMVACLAPRFAYAHPMGNFSVNHYTQITLREDHIEILYMVDMAEIPTYQEIQQAGIVAREGDPPLAAYLRAKGRELLESLTVEVAGKRLQLNLISQQIIFPPGSGGLPTMKMGFVYRAGLTLAGTGASARLRFVDRNFPGHAGWKEIIVNAPTNVLLNSSVPDRDRSNRLSNYPTDLLNSPPQDLEADITFKPSLLAAMSERSSKASVAANKANTTAATHRMLLPAQRTEAKGADAVPVPGREPAAAAPPEAVQLQANKQATPRSAFTELISAPRLSFWFLLVAAVIAAGLGALHALEPGHGKTIVAAYLVGSRGTARHALLLGVIVTISHTAGVYLLGAITLYAQKYVLPERIYPFLGVLSGILIAGMGCYLLLQRYLGAAFAHTHSYESSPDKPANDGAARKAFTSQLLLLGVTGGMIPCPGALVVLLSAVALHRTGLGLFLIVAFSVGLAAVLIAMGLTAVYAARKLSRMRFEGPLTQRWLPMTSAAVITILGFGITVRALITAGIVHLRLWA